MAWRDTRSNYDDIEWGHMELLTKELPSYLEFHERHLGHLPQNFVEEGSGAALAEGDARYDAINRIGFFSYAVFVNLVLLEHTIRALPREFRSAIEVYDHAGRFFLRAGAATDIAMRLAGEAEQDFDHKHQRFAPHRLGTEGRSLSEDLEKRLGAVNAYNNGIKHNGLPALALSADAGGKEGTEVRVLIPNKFAYPHGWAEQKPAAEMADVFATYRPRVFAAFDAFYKKLADDVPRRLTDWQIRPAPAVRGILDVKGAGSGSIDLSDGYVAAWPQA